MAVNQATIAEAIAQKEYLKLVADQRAAALVEAWAAAWDEISADLTRTIEQMATEAAAGTQRVSRPNQLRRNRQALGIASEQLADLCQQTGIAVAADAQKLIQRGIADQRMLAATQLRPTMDLDWTRVDARQVQQIVQRTTEQITVRTWHLQDDATKAMKRELARGLAAGDNPRVAARRMVGRVNGEFNGGLARAQVIARTEQVDAYRRAAQASQDANRDVLAGWQWVATLGPRTCPSCIAHHGEMHDLDEPGPLDHHQGRCARVPVTKSWEELGFKGIKETRTELQPGDGERWFARQDEDTQRSIMGDKRFEAWKDGRFPAEQWSQRKENPDWRPSYHVGTPTPPAGAAAAARTPKPSAPADVYDMTDDDLEAELGRLMAAGDFESDRFQEVSGRIEQRENQDRMEAEEAELIEWQRLQANAARGGDVAAKATTKKATEARLREEYELFVGVQWAKAEEELNGVLLSRAGRQLRREGKLSDLDLFTRQRQDLSLASEELQEWFSRNPRLSFSEFKASQGFDDAESRKVRRRMADRHGESEFD